MALANTWVWYPYTLVGLLVGAIRLTITQNWWWSGILTLVAFVATWAITFVVTFFRAGPQLYYTERDRADLLSDRLRPKLN